MYNIKLFIWYIRWPFRILFILFTSFIILWLVFFYDNFICNFDNYLDPIIAVGTAVFSILIFTEQLSQKYLSSLPKRLTVHFVWEKKILCSCIEAPLPHEGEIRTYAQQIGSQMFKGRLTMHTYFKTSAPRRKPAYFEKNNKSSKAKMINCFEVTIFLRGNLSKSSFEDRSDIICDYNSNNGKPPEFIKSEKYIAWYDNTPDTPGNEEFMFTGKGSGCTFLDSEKFNLDSLIGEIRNPKRKIEEVVKHQEIDFKTKIDSCIKKIESINKRIDNLRSPTDKHAIGYLEEIKHELNENLKKLLAQLKEKKRKALIDSEQNKLE